VNISVLPMGSGKPCSGKNKMCIFVFCLQILSCFVFAPDFSAFVLVYNVLVLYSGIIAAHNGGVS